MITHIDHVHNTDQINVLLTAFSTKNNDQKAQQVSSAIRYWTSPYETNIIHNDRCINFLLISRTSSIKNVCR